MSAIDTQHQTTLPRLNLSGRELYDLEMILVGGFAPLGGFMTEAEYNSVCTSMRLPGGAIFPMPVTLSVSSEAPYAVGDSITLCDQFGNPLAVMDIESRYTPDKHTEAEAVFGASDLAHPGVQYLFSDMQAVYLGGPVRQLALPKRDDFTQWRYTPDELKASFKERGWEQVVGFQTRNPMHRAHFELVKRAHEKTGAPVLVHPVVGMTKPGDIDYVTRVRTYHVVCNTYGKDFTHLALLPLAMRMGGPREALWHALIRKNYGCTHFIVGRDHAGPGENSQGQPFYSPYAARELAEAYAPEIGIEIVPSDELVYSAARASYISTAELTDKETTEHISGTEFRKRLYGGEDIPEWFSFPESVEILRQSVRRDGRPGAAVFFTGLSGAGKSTIAQLLLARLQERQDRAVTFLDGDVIRQHLSKGLGFSREDRETNVRRVGFVAGEVVRHGGLVVTSLIAPYQESREYVRRVVEETGVFVEVFVATSLAECERRDTKGLYQKARSGELPNFTGVSDPYEAPERADVVLETEGRTPEQCVEEILAYLDGNGIVPLQ